MRIRWGIRLPPAPVVFVASTHGLVGAAAGVALVGLHYLTRDLPGIEFGSRTLVFAGGFAAFYLVTATLVWFGVPLAPVLSRLCSLLYLVRPSFGFRVWKVMATEEFLAHFRAPGGPRARGPVDGE